MVAMMPVFELCIASTTDAEYHTLDLIQVGGGGGGECPSAEQMSGRHVNDAGVDTPATVKDSSR